MNKSLGDLKRKCLSNSLDFRSKDSFCSFFCLRFYLFDTVRQTDRQTEKGRQGMEGDRKEGTGKKENCRKG